MADPNHGVHIAAGVEIRLQLHPNRIRCRHQIIQDAIGDLLMGNGAIAVAVHVQLDRLEFNDSRTGLIDQTQYREIGIAREGAFTGELRQFDRHLVRTTLTRVLEADEFSFSDGALAVLGRLGLLLGR